MAWVIFATSSPIKNFGDKNAACVADMHYFRRWDKHSNKAVYTTQMEHASTWENKAAADSRCKQLNEDGQTGGVYLSTLEIKNWI